MISPGHAFLIILVCGVITFILRTLPLYIWSGEKKIPEYVLWLGKVLPYAIMMMLCVFALKGVSFESGAIPGFGSSGGGTVSHGYDSKILSSLHILLYRYSGWLPPLMGVLVTSGTYLWKKNTMLSIILGTACYMLLVQFTIN